MILSWVNTAFYQELMHEMRTAISDQRFDPWREETLTRISQRT
ncbi:MAG: hypothetical protein AAFO75_06750 [Pseudomonadota bacterium]